MNIESLISEHGTLVSIILAAIILLAALICGVLIRNWNKNDKLMDHRGVITYIYSWCLLYLCGYCIRLIFF